MSTPRPTEADVEALAEAVWNAMPAHHTGWRGLKGDERAFYLGIAERLHSFVTARDAEHQGEVDALRAEVDDANDHAIECERIGTKALEDRVLVELERDEARRELADLRAKVAALVDRADNLWARSPGERDHHVSTTDLRALLPTEDDQ